MTARRLIVTADDFGIGPETSRGILDLAAAGAVTTTALLVNSPHAEGAVTAWRDAGEPLALGWHACLTLDGPVSPPARIPSLVDREGRFWGLGAFLARLAWGRIRRADVDAELAAQLCRFTELVGRPPTCVNGHHHAHTLPVVGESLWELLRPLRPRPYVRRVREPWRLLAGVPVARLKRACLHLVGRRSVWEQVRRGFPGNDWLAGAFPLGDPERAAAWLQRVPGETVEWMCHPGYEDATLLGRDAAAPRELTHRDKELRTLQGQDFAAARRRAGFRLASPEELVHAGTEALAHVG